MTTELNAIRKTDARLAAITEGLHGRIPKALEGTIFEKTGAVMTSLVVRLGFLKKGILALAEGDNLYGIGVLFRVFLEHILRVNALFLQASVERSDNFADQYSQLRLSEAFEYLKAYKVAGLDIGNHPKTVLDQWFPEARSLTEKDIGRLVKPFQYKELVKLMRQLLDAKAPDFLAKIIPNYSELSSFVHGGPSAGQALTLLLDDDSRVAEIVRITGLTVGMLYSAERWLLILATSVRPDFQSLLDQLTEAMECDDRGTNKPGTGDTLKHT